MTDDDDAFEVTVKMTRGTGSTDKEKIDATVAAGDLDHLDERMAALEERLREWSEDLRSIQPDERRRHDDQRSLGETKP